jgi:hypothetical protein
VLNVCFDQYRLNHSSANFFNNSALAVMPEPTAQPLFSCCIKAAGDDHADFSTPSGDEKNSLAAKALCKN